MSNLIQQFESKQLEKLALTRNESKDFNLKFNVGDTVTVKYKISEGENTRLQAFMGVVIARSKSLSNYSATFTVRKVSYSIGVERKFTLSSPLISSIEIMKKGVVRRAKLYYLRELTGKAARIKEKLDFIKN
jgi:large subunit ribosomal protein L19